MPAPTSWRRVGTASNRGRPGLLWNPGKPPALASWRRDVRDGRGAPLPCPFLPGNTMPPPPRRAASATGKQAGESVHAWLKRRRTTGPSGRPPCSEQAAPTRRGSDYAPVYSAASKALPCTTLPAVRGLAARMVGKDSREKAATERWRSHYRFVMTVARALAWGLVRLKGDGDPLRLKRHGAAFGTGLQCHQPGLSLESKGSICTTACSHSLCEMPRYSRKRCKRSA